MPRLLSLRTSVATISVAVGILFGLFPRNWLELRLGFQLDGGNGLFEFLLVAVPLAIGVILALGGHLRLQRRRSEQLAAT